MRHDKPQSPGGETLIIKLQVQAGFNFAQESSLLRLASRTSLRVR